MEQVGMETRQLSLQRGILGAEKDVKGLLARAQVSIAALIAYFSLWSLHAVLVATICHPKLSR
jgi:hypothetical protein